LVGLSIACLLLAVNTGQQEGWTPRVLGLIALTLALTAAFVLRELTARFPLLRFGLFRTPGFSPALIGQTMQTMSGSSNLFLLPFFLVSIQGRSEAEAGLILLASSVTSSLVSPLGGWLSDRFETRAVAAIGAAGMTGGSLLLSSMQLSWRPIDIMARIVVLSIGSGLFISPNASAAYEHVRVEDRGLAVGTLAFIRNLGFTLGTAVAASIWTLRRLADAHRLGIDPSSATAQIAGLHDTYLVIAALAVIALLSSLGRPRVSPTTSAKTAVALME
ncbi:MAG: MFS transporter, partial [Chloroflexota bacterium]